MAPHPLPEITYLPAFLADPQELFAQLSQGTVWDDRMYSRRTASFGVAYNYSGIFYPDATMPPAIAGLAARVATQVAHPINNCLANLYADGAQTMGFHSDATADLKADSTVSVLSLGAARTLTFRSKTQRQYRLEYALEPGALLIMAPSVQAQWQHALLKAEGAGPRISLTFRQVQPRQP